MNCPRHQAELKQSLVEGHEIERCPDCDGIWVPGEAIDALLGEGELLKLRSLCSARPSPLVCPQDGKRLGRGSIARVTIDLCPQCSGLWLDPGELEKLQARPKKKTSSMRDALLADGKRGSLDTTDVFSDGLLALLLSI